MSELTREQFKAAIASAISGVEHLYREVDLLIAGLREALLEEPESLTLKRGTLGKSGKEDSKRIVVRHEYGALFEPALEDEDEGDEDDDEGNDDPDVHSTKAKRERRRHEIAADQPLLAVRVAMYDPRRRAAFEPQVEYAVMSEWALGDTWQPSDRFALQSYMLKRVPRALADRVGISSGDRIPTRAAARRIVGAQRSEDRRLSCRLPAGVEAIPLYTLDNAEALERLAETVKAMWTRVIR